MTDKLSDMDELVVVHTDLIAEDYLRLQQASTRYNMTVTEFIRNAIVLATRINEQRFLNPDKPHYMAYPPVALLGFYKGNKGAEE